MQAGNGSAGAAAAPPPQSPQQFCLRWNNYQSNLTNVFDQLLQSESFVDVTLACDGHSVKAHKMVLSACSPYFQSLFFDNPCQHPIVILKDIKWPELKAVVEFMYKGEINVSQEQIGPLLRVAESLKIRGLADVNNEQELGKGLEDVTLARKKRRRTSTEVSSPGEEESLETRALELVTTSPPTVGGPTSASQPPSVAGSLVPLPLGPPPPPPPQAEDMEIKPGIAEMIREEERAKMLESSHAWLGASTSSLAADSYQYQLQSMWQKCWNTNQSLVHNLRFRERGPLKSWRPETMAEAILSVLKEGLSLSQAARKYDIPYPTFVLYANRVHNMLGPSADGGSDLRPKGRGRPQRILLGIWPEDHIRGVIRAVVFRDPQHMKEDPLNLGYHHRLSSVRSISSPKSQMCTPDSVQSYGSGGGGSSSGPGSVGEAVSPNAAAAAVVAVAQNLRQQMLAAAHVHHPNHGGHPGQFGGFLAAAAANAHCGNGAANLMLHSPSPVESSPRSSPLTQPNNNMEMGMNMGYKPMINDSMTPRPGEHMFQDEIEDLVKRPHPSETPRMKSEQMAYSPLPNDLSMRAEHLFQDDMALMKRAQQQQDEMALMKRTQQQQDDMALMKRTQQQQDDMALMKRTQQQQEPPKVKVGLGVSGMTYKTGCETGYGPPRSSPASLLQDDFESLVKSPPPASQPKDSLHMPPIDQRSE